MFAISGFLTPKCAMSSDSKAFSLEKKFLDFLNKKTKRQPKFDCPSMLREKELTENVTFEANFNDALRFDLREMNRQDAIVIVSFDRFRANLSRQLNHPPKFAVAIFTVTNSHAFRDKIVVHFS
jgi:hypothetical protein